MTGDAEVSIHHVLTANFDNNYVCCDKYLTLNRGCATVRAVQSEVLMPDTAEKSPGAASNAPDYKDSVNLPQTDFPMRANLTKREPEALKAWEDKDL